jgi:hypothetical protein
VRWTTLNIVPAISARRTGADHLQESISNPRRLLANRYPQQAFCCWIGGQGTLPNEQKTQQSPAFGRSSSPQPVQS